MVALSGSESSLNDIGVRPCLRFLRLGDRSEPRLNDIGVRLSSIHSQADLDSEPS
ncbi:hypothetical protein [Ligilactobacillus salivarius]|uniref:hypothetical protein n=1 Tax=Ligilactobacillus salivarius TaxID=1624 RepID=UPI003F8BE983